jgi:hypothetical protein
MRLRFFFIGLLMMAVPGFTAAWAAQTDASTDQQTAPRIVAPEGNYHFPSVVDGAKVEHEFVIENKGNAPLKISKVKTG